MYDKNTKHIWRTHQNIIEIWLARGEEGAASLLVRAEQDGLRVRSRKHRGEERNGLQKSWISAKNREKCTVKIPNTFGERINTVLKSGSYCSKISETQSKPEKSPKRYQRNSKVP